MSICLCVDTKQQASVSLQENHFDFWLQATETDWLIKKKKRNLQIWVYSGKGLRGVEDQESRFRNRQEPWEL